MNIVTSDSWNMDFKHLRKWVKYIEMHTNDIYKQNSV